MVCTTPNIFTATGPVQIVYGPHDVTMALAGLMIAEVANAVRDLMSLPPWRNVEAYIDGRRVGFGVTVWPGDRVEFVKEWGKKGAGIEQPGDPRHQCNQLLWELVQEVRELNRSAQRIADHFDPPKIEQPDILTALKALEAKIDGLYQDELNDSDCGKKDWYTTKEAAEVLPFKDGTLRQACNLGRIPDAKKIGREWRIPHATVERIANMGLPPSSE